MVNALQHCLSCYLLLFTLYSLHLALNLCSFIYGRVSVWYVVTSDIRPEVKTCLVLARERVKEVSAAYPALMLQMPLI